MSFLLTTGCFSNKNYAVTSNFIFFCLLFFATTIRCTYNHEDDLKFTCNATDTLLFSDIEPIIVSKCAISGCHNVTNNYIPHLSSRVDVINNRWDCKSQIESNAMPPQQSAMLTDNEKLKILCWIEHGGK